MSYQEAEESGNTVAESRILRVGVVLQGSQYPAIVSGGSNLPLSVLVSSLATVEKNRSGRLESSLDRTLAGLIEFLWCSSQAYPSTRRPLF